MAEIAVGNDMLLIGSTPMLDETTLVGLSAAERQVLALLIAGSTDRDFAMRRARARAPLPTGFKPSFANTACAHAAD